MKCAAGVMVEYQTPAGKMLRSAVNRVFEIVVHQTQERAVCLTTQKDFVPASRLRGIVSNGKVVEITGFEITPPIDYKSGERTAKQKLKSQNPTVEVTPARECLNDAPTVESSGQIAKAVPNDAPPTEGTTGTEGAVATPIDSESEHLGTLEIDDIKRPADPASEWVNSTDGVIRNNEGTILAIDFMNWFCRAFFPLADDEHVVPSMFATLSNAIDEIGPIAIVLAMDDGYTHRTAMWPDYKQNRDPKPERFIPELDRTIAAFFATGIPMVRVSGFEADDVLATIFAQQSNVVISSSDKDLLSTGCQLYQPWNGGKKETARSRLGIRSSMVGDFLALKGDKADGIPGCPGIGDKTAVDLLTRFKNLDAIIAAAHAGEITGKKRVENLIEYADRLRIWRRVVEPVANLQVNWIQDIPGDWRKNLEAVVGHSNYSSLARWLDSHAESPIQIGYRNPLIGASNEFGAGSQ